MSDRLDEKAKCPFYLSVMRSGKLFGVSCEGLEKNLGFDATHFLRFKTQKDLIDYTEIFCCDRYIGCKYYQAVMKNKYHD